MRQAFTEALVALAGRDPRILLLTGDLGYKVLEPFAEKFPDRFFNVGVAEQNMVGLATGLADAGYIPFIYSIATFASLRPYEIIRDGPILHRLPVRIVGVGSGFDYGHNGITHYSLEDIAVMRAQPGISVIAPADAAQTRAAIQATWDREGPIYYRLGKDDNLVVPGLDGRFELGRAHMIRDGSDLLIVAIGTSALQAVEAAGTLAGHGLSAAVLVVSSLNPDPTADLVAALSRFPLALTVEAHYAAGGLGSLVCEVVAQGGLRCKVVVCAVRQFPNGRTGSQAYLEHLYGISAQAVVQAALESVKLAIR